MPNFTVNLAGHIIAVTTIHLYTLALCRGYLTDAVPEFELITTPEDIADEAEKSAHEDEVEGRTPHTFHDGYLESLSVYRKIAETLLNDKILLLHGSVVAVDGEEYMFTAKSGTGKSTHTRLWREVFTSRAVMVNDDKPLLRIENDKVISYGTP